MNAKHYVRLLFVLALTLLPGQLLRSQTLTSATVTGVITDESGAIVPNASVQIVQTDTGAVHKTVSTSSGGYRFPFLNPGDYEISVEAEGLVARPVKVHLVIGQETAVPLKLAVKSVSETVDVQAPNELLQTENANNVSQRRRHHQYRVQHTGDSAQCRWRQHKFQCQWSPLQFSAFHAEWGGHR